MESFDYVIVGAGSAGSVLASRLSEDPNVTVCVLEAGPRDWHPFIHIPAGFMYTLVDPKVNWLYKSEPSEWTGGRAIAAPRGKTLGGSSSINGHIYNRGQRLDFDGWAQRGNRGWGYSDVLPYFRRSENRMAGDADATFRGSEGNLPITDLEWRDPLCEAFIEGAVEQGIPRNPDYNGTKQAGVSYVQRIIRNGRRVSAARGYLHPAMSRPNLTVRTHAQATSIVLEGKRAVGVRYRKGGRNGTPVEVRAKREVIVSAGAIGSPKLLLLSGVGPADALRKLGIEVVADLPGVGENFSDHFGVDIVYELSGAYSYDKYNKPWWAAWAGLQYLLFKSGPVVSNIVEGGAFTFSDPALTVPDLQFHFLAGAGVEAGVPAIASGSGCTMNSYVVRPKSRGSVKLQSADFRQAPLIDPNFIADPDDLQVAAEGVRISREIMQQQAFAKYIRREHFPGESVSGTNALKEYVKQYGRTSYHPNGTCKMGQDAMAVVDPQLKVRGIEGLRVIDSSIFPSLIGSNTNAPTIMVAEKGADLVRSA